jgi:uncharacterized protein YgfB (UPF0149 family)
MNQPTMTNEQFAMWVSLGQGMDSKLFERADAVLNWLDKSEKKVVKPIMPKTK